MTSNTVLYDNQTIQSNLTSEMYIPLEEAMTSNTVLYDNKTIQGNLTSIAGHAAQSAYLRSSICFIVFSVARYCQIFVGIPGNIMTLLILKRLRVRLNMHIIMGYMALSDTLASATLPIGTYINAPVAEMISFKDEWDIICVIYVFLINIGFIGVVSSYFMLSIDR